MNEPDIVKLDRGNIVAFIAEIIERRGADFYLGEDLTISQHILQGAQLAETAGASDELIAAILLHDIGHYTNEFPTDALANNINDHHDSVGAAVLEPYFPEFVTQCVRQHVAAKRYLCATDPTYIDKLSTASVHTLGLQGGPMSDEEVAEFRRHPHLQDILQVRFWDEAAKEKGKATPGFAHYVALLQRVVDKGLN